MASNAWLQWAAAVDVEGNLYDSDPLYQAVAAETEECAKIKWSLLRDLLSTAPPTTIDGVAAFADYCGELHQLCESELVEDHLFVASERISRALKALSHRFD